MERVKYFFQTLSTQLNIPGKRIVELKGISVFHMRTRTNLSTLAPSGGYIKYCGYIAHKITAHAPCGCIATRHLELNPLQCFKSYITLNCISLNPQN